MKPLKSKYIHPITLKAALEVASNLRSEDFREISDGHGIDPLTYLAAMSTDPATVYFTSPSGKAAGMAGVGKKGDIWMLCTNVIHEQPTLFARQAKRYVDSREEPLLFGL